MIPKIPFGNTGHESTRTLFGAAALGAMKQEKADKILELLLSFGVNHIDVAASYGDAELRLAPWLKHHRKDFFLATKTGDRTAEGARESIHRSLERMQVDHVDLIQFHNLTDEEGWQVAMGTGGALEAAIEARNQGLVRFIGVTGHGTQVADMHLRSLEQFDFDSVLLPYSIMMMQNPDYAASFEKLYAKCQQQNIAMQTIKSIARRRWREDDPAKRFSWYEPIREEGALRRAVHWNFKRAGIFLNTSSDGTLLPALLKAASEFDETDTQDISGQVQADATSLAMEPLFISGMADSI